MKLNSVGAASVSFCCGMFAAMSAQAVPPDHAGGGATAITECQIVDESGSFVVSANLPGGDGYLSAGDYPGAVDGDCILIVVSGVDLDLGGHVITGDDDSGTDGSGVHALQVQFVDDGEHVNVYNGVIRDFYDGINFADLFFSTVENITSYSNDHHGIEISGDSNYIRNNKSIGNDFAGIIAGHYIAITENISLGNGGVGISTSGNSIVRGNSVSNNGNGGLNESCPSIVDGNVIEGNNVADLTLNGAGCIDVNNAVGP